MSSPAPERRPLVFLVPFVVAALLGGGALFRAPAMGATPPPTPVPPKGSLSPFPTALQTRPPSPRQPPKLGAKAVVVMDARTGQVLFARRPSARRPIASLTKIMTALLVIEGSRLREEVTVSADAAPPPNQAGISNLQLRTGERLSVEELLYALLLQSANDAAVALAEHEGGSVPAFVRAMNRRAAELGASGTRFASPNGLDDSGLSTASDLATVMRAALNEPTFRKIARTRFHTVPAPPGGKPRKIQNRNVLLWLYPGTVAGKTGFTSRAGYCLVAAAEHDGRELIVVVLGERGEAFSDAAELLDWGFASFVPVTAGLAGDPVGTRDVGGTGQPVALGEDLEGLVLRPESHELRLRVRVDPEAPARPSPGEVVGSVAAVAPSGVVAEVPLVVAAAREPVAWNHVFERVLADYERTLERVSR